VEIATAWTGEQRRARGSVCSEANRQPTRLAICLEDTERAALRSVMAVTRGTSKHGAAQLGGGIRGERRTGRTACTSRPTENHKRYLRGGSSTQHPERRVRVGPTFELSRSRRLAKPAVASRLERRVSPSRSVMAKRCDAASRVHGWRLPQPGQMSNASCAAQRSE
jgi:hypothetical protein